MNNHDRREKEIVASNLNEAVKPIRKAPFGNKADEINFVAEEIYRLISETHIKPNEIAVLSRYNSKIGKTGKSLHPELEEIGRILNKKGITTSSSVKMNYDRESSKIIKNLCKMLMFFSNDEIVPECCNLIIEHSFTPSNFSALILCINEEYKLSIPNNASFKTIMEQVVNVNPKLKTPNDQKRIEKLILAYQFYIKQRQFFIDGAMPSEIIANLIAFYIQNNLGYSNYKNIYERSFEFSKSSEESYEEEDGNKYFSIVTALNAFLCDSIKQEPKRSVKLLTAHQSKGLQFDVVFVVGLEAGNFPSNFEKLDERNLDNERRLFYVCVTRAKELLYLTSTGYAIDNNKELIDKSFIYTVPEKYFSNGIESFDDINFSEPNDELNDDLEREWKIIEDLKFKQAQDAIKLEEALNKLTILENENKNLSKNKKDNDKSKELINKLKEEISKLYSSIENKDIYIDNLQLQIKKLSKDESKYRKEIDNLKKNNQGYHENELDKILKEYNLTKTLLAEANAKKQQLQDLYDSEKNENEKLKKSCKEKPKEIEVTKYIEKVIEIPKIIERVKTSSKDEIIISSIKSFNDRGISDETKRIIEHLFDVFITNNSYPELTSLFKSGLSNYQELIESTRDYVNGLKTADVYRSDLNAYSYKGNLSNLINKILTRATYYERDNFYLPGFIDAYFGRRDLVYFSFSNSKKYKKYVNNLKNQFNLEINEQLLNNMYISYCIYTVCNHEKNEFEENPLHKHYREVSEKFIHDPNINRYPVFSAFFILISLFVDNDRFMSSIK